MNNDLTCIYYTSNKEKPEFESKIHQTLLEAIGNLPLISVSQKPIDFGKNICVGDVGVSGQNAFRQLLIGVRESKTKFICTCESDFIYPKEYFNLRPEKEDVFYTVHPVYIIYAQRGKTHVYFRMRINEAAMVVGRDYLIHSLEEMLEGLEMWGNNPPPGHALRSLWLNKNRDRFHINVPIVTFKTDQGMHRKSTHIRGSHVTDLPYWGNYRDLLRKYL